MGAIASYSSTTPQDQSCACNRPAWQLASACAKCTGAESTDMLSFADFSADCTPSTRGSDADRFAIATGWPSGPQDGAAWSEAQARKNAGWPIDLGTSSSIGPSPVPSPSPSPSPAPSPEPSAVTSTSSPRPPPSPGTPAPASPPPIATTNELSPTARNAIIIGAASALALLICGTLCACWRRGVGCFAPRRDPLRTLIARSQRKAARSGPPAPSSSADPGWTTFAAPSRQPSFVQASYTGVSAAYPAGTDYHQQAALQQAWAQPVAYPYVEAGPQWQRSAGIVAPPSVNPPTIAGSEKGDRRTRVASTVELSETSGAAVVADSAAPSRTRRKGLRSVASSTA